MVIELKIVARLTTVVALGGGALLWGGTAPLASTSDPQGGSQNLMEDAWNLGSKDNAVVAKAKAALLAQGGTGLAALIHLKAAADVAEGVLTDLLATGTREQAKASLEACREHGWRRLAVAGLKHRENDIRKHAADLLPPPGDPAVLAAVIDVLHEMRREPLAVGGENLAAYTLLRRSLIDYVQRWVGSETSASEVPSDSEVARALDVGRKWLAQKGYDRR